MFAHHFLSLSLAKFHSFMLERFKMWSTSTLQFKWRILFCIMTMTIWIKVCVRMCDLNFSLEFCALWSTTLYQHANACACVCVCSMLNVHSIITLFSQIHQLLLTFVFSSIHFEASFLTFFAHTKMHNEIFLIFPSQMINTKKALEH